MVGWSVSVFNYCVFNVFAFFHVSDGEIDSKSRVVGTRCADLIICWRLWSDFIVGQTFFDGWGAYDVICCDCGPNSVFGNGNGNRLNTNDEKRSRCPWLKFNTLYLRNGTGRHIQCGAEQWLVEKDIALVCKGGCFLYSAILVFFIPPLWFTHMGVNFSS